MREPRLLVSTLLVVLLAAASFPAVAQGAKDQEEEQAAELAAMAQEVKQQDQKHAEELAAMAKEVAEYRASAKRLELLRDCRKTRSDVAGYHAGIELYDRQLESLKETIDGQRAWLEGGGNGLGASYFENQVQTYKGNVERYKDRLRLRSLQVENANQLITRYRERCAGVQATDEEVEAACGNSQDDFCAGFRK